MNILESLRKIENKIYREQDKSIDLQGMYLTEDVDKDKLWEMINKNDIDGVINLLEGNSINQLLTEKWHDGDDDIRNWLYDHEQAAEDCLNFFDKEDLYSIEIEDILNWISDHDTLSQDFEGHFGFSIDDWFNENSSESDSDWVFEDVKSVLDFDGFWTEYTLWKKSDEDYWVCVFGDSDLYRPEDGYFDAEFESEREAREWFDNYTGFEDEDLDESLNNKELKESKKGTVEQMWDGDTYSYHLYVDGKKVGSFWEFDEVEDFAKNHDIILDESFNKNNLKESMKGNDIELEMSSIKELIEWLETHPFDKVEDINIEVNNGGNSFSYYLYWSSPRVNVGSYPIVQIDRNDKTIFSKEGDELPTKESYKNFINETIDFLKNYTENFVENLKESVYTENGFKNRKEYLNSLADDYGVDVQTVYDLASVLGPDEDFDALVTELEDVVYSQDDDHDGDTEYVGKQFGLTSYYDDKLRGVEDYIELNWGDDPDLEDWIWDKCSQGHYVVLRDWSNGEETKFRPVEEDDIDVKDLIVSKSELFGTDGTVK